MTYSSFYYLSFVFIILLFFMDYMQEKGISIRAKIAGFPIVIRWRLYYAMIFCILVFGKYGYGFDASEFIYMKF